MSFIVNQIVINNYGKIREIKDRQIKNAVAMDRVLVSIFNR